MQFGWVKNFICYCSLDSTNVYDNKVSAKLITLIKVFFNVVVKCHGKTLLKTSVISLNYVTLSKFLKYERKHSSWTSGMSTAAQEK